MASGVWVVYLEGGDGALPAAVAQHAIEVQRVQMPHLLQTFQLGKHSDVEDGWRSSCNKTSLSLAPFEHSLLA